MEFSVGLIVSYDGNLSDMAKLGNPWIFQQTMVDGGEKLVYIPLKKKRFISYGTYPLKKA